MSPEETFRRVLAARLPSGPGWTAWIDGTVSELAACVQPKGIDRGMLIEALTEVVPLGEHDWQGISTPFAEALADRILALQWPEAS